MNKLLLAILFVSISSIAICQSNLRQLKDSIKEIINDDEWTVRFRKESYGIISKEKGSYKKTLVIRKGKLEVEYLICSFHCADTIKSAIMNSLRYFSCSLLEVEELRTKTLFLNKYVIFIYGKCMRTFKQEEIQLIKLLINNLEK